MNPFLLEVGTEEIPAGYIQPALDALASNLTAKLAQARISHGAVHTFGTPRRLVVRLDGVAGRQQSITEASFYMCIHRLILHSYRLTIQPQ